MGSRSFHRSLRRLRAGFGRGVSLTSLALALASAGCAANGLETSAHTPAGPTATAPAGPAVPEHILAVYRSHCGSCHRPVAPGAEPRDRLDAELLRHRQRTRLTEQEWAGLGSFLAARR